MKILITFLLAVQLLQVQSQNLLLNPGFESRSSGWVPFSTNAAFSFETVVNTNAHSGTSCAKLSVYNNTTVSAGALQTLTVTPLQH